MPNIKKSVQNYLLHDAITFTIIMGIIVGAVVTLFIYDSSTHFFNDFSKQVYEAILRLNI